jgi:hypothetical protein
MLWTQAKVWSMLYEHRRADRRPPPTLRLTARSSAAATSSYSSKHWAYGSYTASYPATWPADEEDEDERPYKLDMPSGAYQMHGTCYVCQDMTWLHEDWMVCQTCLLHRRGHRQGD